MRIIFLLFGTAHSLLDFGIFHKDFFRGLSDLTLKLKDLLSESRLRHFEWLSSFHNNTFLFAKFCMIFILTIMSIKRDWPRPQSLFHRNLRLFASHWPFRCRRNVRNRAAAFSFPFKFMEKETRLICVVIFNHFRFHYNLYEIILAYWKLGWIICVSFFHWRLLES